MKDRKSKIPNKNIKCKSKGRYRDLQALSEKFRPFVGIITPELQPAGITGTEQSEGRKHITEHAWVRQPGVLLLIPRSKARCFTYAQVKTHRKNTQKTEASEGQCGWRQPSCWSVKTLDPGGLGSWAWLYQHRREKESSPPPGVHR